MTGSWLGCICNLRSSNSDVLWNSLSSNLAASFATIWLRALQAPMSLALRLPGSINSYALRCAALALVPWITFLVIAGSRSAKTGAGSSPTSVQMTSLLSIRSSTRPRSLNSRKRRTIPTGGGVGGGVAGGAGFAFGMGLTCFVFFFAIVTLFLRKSPTPQSILLNSKLSGNSSNSRGRILEIGCDCLR